MTLHVGIDVGGTVTDAVGIAGGGGHGDPLLRRVRSRSEDEAAAVVLDEFISPACGTLLRSRIRVEPRTEEAAA